MARIKSLNQGHNLRPGPVTCKEYAALIRILTYYEISIFAFKCKSPTLERGFCLI